MSKESYLARLRFLTVALFLSGSFNIFLMAFLFYWAFKEQPPTPYCENKPKVAEAKEIKANNRNGERIRYFKTLKFNDLAQKIKCSNPVEDGVSERELALAVLTAFHDFDLRKALASSPYPIKQKILVLGGGERLGVFYGLREEQFAALESFIAQEKWPFKARGLFLLLKNDRSDPSLEEAFFLTLEFSSVKTLFSRSNISIGNHELLDVVLDGEWGLLSAFRERQKLSHDLTDENRQRFLLDYIKEGSSAAAYLLLKTDWEFGINRLNDEAVLTILRLLTKKTDEAKRFVQALAASPRGDAVRQLAQNRLAEFIGPQPVLQEKVLTSLNPKKAYAVDAPKKPLSVKQGRIYVVQEGDSLWKIAKKFNLKVESIKSYNRLSSDLLQPGTILKIP